MTSHGRCGRGAARPRPRCVGRQYVGAGLVPALGKGSKDRAGSETSRRAWGSRCEQSERGWTCHHEGAAVLAKRSTGTALENQRRLDIQPPLGYTNISRPGGTCCRHDPGQVPQSDCAHSFSATDQHCTRASLRVGEGWVKLPFIFGEG